MSKKGTWALQEYLDDLLLDDGSSVAADPRHAEPLDPGSSVANPPSEQPVPQAPTAQAAPASEVARASAADELAVLEQTKREKLQALLNSKPLVLSPQSQSAEAVVAAPPAEQVELAVITPRLEMPAQEVVPAVDVEFDDPELLEQQLAEPQIEPEIAPEIDPAAAASAEVSPFLDWHQNGRPHWAQQRFDALLFNVSGLTLAVPLIALGQIQPLTDELTPLFGQADWFMGLLPTPAGKIRTVNTALFVMPERYDERFAETAKYVVSIDGLPWGLAVDSIAQPISLDPQDVKWRTERSKRPWLAGTVKAAMCALIDIPQMGKMLSDADKGKPRRNNT